MPTHPDAVGYLNDLAKEINEPWFKMVCDLAAMSGVSVLDQPTLDTLFALYIKRASYIGIKPAAAAAAVAAPAAPADSLEQLSGFTNFKLLGDALEVSFKKRITLIFGANSSGKSSLCESLKVLATPEPPVRPLQNVRAAGAATPEFRYKFKSDAAQQAWTPTVGYGPKQGDQEVLAKALIPKDGTLEGLLALLRAASPLCRMDEAAGHACPLCKRDLGIPEVELFKRYHELLADPLEKDIAALKGDIAKAVEFATAVVNVDRKAWGKCTTIQAEVLTAAKTSSDLIVASCEVSKEPTAEAKAALESLKASAAAWAAQLEAKKNAIEAAAKGREELVKQLAKLRGEIEPLEYAQAIAERLEKLREAERMVDDSKFWSAKLPVFTQVLKRITEKAKDAHEELVVMDFEARLDAEYKALAEKDMAAFGVVLARKGTDAAVTVLPQIGGKDIEGVLSEGKQRVHALALFFAELETCPQSVLVFDDPISSFDYNYIANYCARLRDFTLKHPVRQIIVLTHNWEFFVQLQTTLNQAGLDPHLSVQILENCAVVADYSEKIDDLKKDIEAVLVAAGEPSKAKREETAGKMRRLIEAVVNTHVFNDQRHQYKQKSQVITAFQSFTKIVALLPAEATTLRGLYAKLSPAEHDDPRNFYVNTDKAMFQTRYDQIVAVETAIKARIP